MTKDQEASRLKAAAQWYAALQDADLDPATWDAFTAWERDPDNAAAFRRVEDGLALADRTALGQAQPQSSPARHPARPKRGLKTARIWLACAAAALALGAVSIFLIHADPPPQAIIHASAVGEIRTDTLDDGTEITLNTDTQLQVSYSSAERRVDLIRGQALFAVAPGPRPFTVTAAGSETRAHGTLFEIFLGPEDMSVTLIEGAVSVVPQAAGTASGQGAGMSPGEAGIATRLVPGDRLILRGGEIESLTQVDTDQALAWRSGMLQFRDVTLEEAVAEMNRYSGLKLRVQDTALGQERLSGTFPAGEPEDFAASLELLLPVRAQKSGNEISLWAVENAR